MPPRYARKYRSRRRRTTKKRSGWGSTVNRFMRNASGAAGLAYSAYKGVQYIRGLVNSEMYKHDLVVASTNISSTGAIVNTCSIPQNDGASGRTGNSVLVKALNAKGALTWNSASALQVVRLVAFIDTQQVADAVGPGPCAGTDTGILTTYSPWSHLNPACVGRYKILYNHMFTLDAYNPIRNYEINIPLQHHVRWNGAAAGDYAKGIIYLMYVCSDVTNPSYYNLDSRISYHDN